MNTSGALIVAATMLLLCLALGANVLTRQRYALLRRELARDRVFEASVLHRAVNDTQIELGRLPAGANTIDTVGIVERVVHAELRGLLLAERFVKASGGLLITLGLVGTFYGLTLSIGKLVKLVASDLSPDTDIAQSLTHGLTDALGGMSVAFSTSLVGILAAIFMTFVGVFANIPEARATFVSELESHLDRLVVAHVGPGEAAARATEQFAQAVGVLQHSIQRFEQALDRFSGNTRDFHEFNAHLKDNIARMSVSFADLSSSMAERAGRLPGGRP